jgi:hypothetical protein
MDATKAKRAARTVTCTAEASSSQELHGTELAPLLLIVRTSRKNPEHEQRGKAHAAEAYTQQCLDR